MNPKVYICNWPQWNTIRAELNKKDAVFMETKIRYLNILERGTVLKSTGILFDNHQLESKEGCHWHYVCTPPLALRLYTATGTTSVHRHWHYVCTPPLSLRLYTATGTTSVHRHWHYVCTPPPALRLYTATGTTSVHRHWHYVCTPPLALRLYTATGTTYVHRH